MKVAVEMELGFLVLLLLFIYSISLTEVGIMDKKWTKKLYQIKKGVE
jgi:hypothetical protein